MFNPNVAPSVQRLGAVIAGSALAVLALASCKQNQHSAEPTDYGKATIACQYDQGLSANSPDCTASPSKACAYDAKLTADSPSCLPLEDDVNSVPLASQNHTAGG